MVLAAGACRGLVDRQAAESTYRILAATQEQLDLLPADLHASIIEGLHDATQHLEDAVAEMAKVEEPEGVRIADDDEPAAEELRDAAQRAESVVERVQAVLTAAAEAAVPSAEAPSPNGAAQRAKRRHRPTHTRNRKNGDDARK